MKVPLPVRAFPAFAFRAWLTPPPGRPAHDADDLAPVELGDVWGYEFGTGRLALAVHGWGGRAAQMVPIATKLADDGYRVVVPELPGHAGGNATDIKKVAAALRSVVADVGQPEIVIGHSFAGMMFRLVFDAEAPPPMVLVAPVLNVNDALDVFADRLRLLPWARRGLRKRLEAWDPQLWPMMSDVLPDQFPGAEMLIIHDPDDPETSFARAAELAALRGNTSIVALEGAGHNRILSDPRTLDHLAGFAHPGVEGVQAASQVARHEPLA